MATRTGRRYQARETRGGTKIDFTLGAGTPRMSTGTVSSIVGMRRRMTKIMKTGVTTKIIKMAVVVRKKMTRNRLRAIGD